MDLSIFFYPLVLPGCGYAIWRGSHSERYAAAIYLAGAIATTLVGTSSGWSQFELPVFLIDLLVLIGFWGLCLRTRRFWPYWITGWQLVGVLVHIQKALLPGITAAPYGYLSLHLAYPILALIVLASVARRREAISTAYWR